MNAITIEDIINTLNIKQHDRLISLKPDDKKVYKDVPKFMNTLDVDMKDRDFILDNSLSDGNDFITQLLRVIYPDIILLDNDKIREIIKEVRNRLSLDLEQRKLYSKFGYNRTKKFNKKSVMNMLFNMNIKIDTDLNIMNYIATYFDINIIIYITDFKFETLSSTNIFYSKLKNNKLNINTPFVEFVYTNKYYPIIDLKTNEGIRKYSDNIHIKNILKIEQMNLIDYSNLTKYKVKDLNDLCITNKIETTKISDKTKKMIKKSKKELYDNLFILNLI